LEKDSTGNWGLKHTTNSNSEACNYPLRSEILSFNIFSYFLFNISLRLSLGFFFLNCRPADMNVWRNQVQRVIYMMILHVCHSIVIIHFFLPLIIQLFTAFKLFVYRTQNWNLLLLIQKRNNWSLRCRSHISNTTQNLHDDFSFWKLYSIFGGDDFRLLGFIFCHHMAHGVWLKKI
jgi:hypothetical protein